MRLPVFLALFLALLPGYGRAATGQKVGTSTEVDVSARKVQATGSSTSRPLSARFADVVNVKDYGAKGDGVSDDSAAFALVAAAADASSAPPTVIFPAGTYRYSSGLVFQKPVTIRATPGAVLKYEGAEYAIKLGPDGLNDTTYLPYRKPFVVEGLGFVGGASMTHGIYVNDHVVYSSIRYCWFEDFGNATSYAIFFQADNWDAEVVHNNFLVSSGGAKNFLRVRGYSTGGVADFGNSRARVLHNNVTNITAAGGVGVWVNGANSDVSHNKIEGFAPNVRLGSWANESIVLANYFETISGNAIEYGDPAGGDQPNAFLGKLRIDKNRHNAHHLDALAGTGYFLAPSGSGTGLQYSYVTNNQLDSYSPSTEMVLLNDKFSQVENVAEWNRGFTVLRTTGGSRSPWEGLQGGFVAKNGVDSSYYVKVGSGATADQYKGVQFIDRTGAVQSQIAVAATGEIQISTAPGATTHVVDFRTDGRAYFQAGVTVNESGASRPTCASTVRGMFWVTRSSAGVKDAVEVCAKDAADAYGWRTIY
jgi:hypothetical protein